MIKRNTPAHSGGGVFVSVKPVLFGKPAEGSSLILKTAVETIGPWSSISLKTPDG
jgi:hypothetical protein